MKVIIAGSREFDDYAELLKAIQQSGFTITEVVSGKARGADSLGEEWANENSIPVKDFPAKWDDITTQNAIVKTKWNPWKKRQEKYNANAGFERNQQMADYADGLIAIQTDGDTKGTQDMIKKANKAGLKIYIHRKYKYDF